MIKQKIPFAETIRKSEDRPRILVSVIGGGLGHVTRTYAILMKLRSYADIHVMSNGIGYEFFRKTEFDTTEIDSIELRGSKFTISLTSYMLDNIRLPFALGKNYRIFSEKIDTFKPDVILSDSEPYSLIAARIKKVPVIAITNYLSTISEFNKLPKERITKGLENQVYAINQVIDSTIKNSNLVINPSAEVVKSQSRIMAFPGMIVRKKKNELPNVEILRRKHNLPDRFYLVSFGGSDYGIDLMKRLLPILQEKTGKNFVVSTNNYVKSTKRIGNVTLVPFIEDYLEYLKCSSGTISTAGLSTIFETLSFGKPSLIFPIHNHVEQICNANFLDRKRYAVVCYLDEHLDPKKIRVKLARFMANAEKIEERIVSARLNDGGAEESTELILNTVKSEKS